MLHSLVLFTNLLVVVDHLMIAESHERSSLRICKHSAFDGSQLVGRSSQVDQSMLNWRDIFQIVLRLLHAINYLIAALKFLLSNNWVVCALWRSIIIDSGRWQADVNNSFNFAICIERQIKTLLRVHSTHRWTHLSFSLFGQESNVRWAHWIGAVPLRQRLSFIRSYILVWLALAERVEH